MLRTNGGYLFKWIWCGLLILAATIAEANEKNSFEFVRPLLFQVKTLTSENAEKTSYGTGFVIEKTGWLATNFHVVADSIWKPKKYKIYVDVDGANIEAQVIGTDIVNDLAIIKTDKSFSQNLKLATRTIKHGSEVLSFGLPEDLNWTVVKGVYNGLLEQGPYQTIHLSAPLNPGMSGGPTLNNAGDVIGINAAGRRASQEISFAVPAQKLIELIARTKARGKKEIDHMQDIESNASELQKSMFELILKGFSQSKKLGDWNLPKFDKSIRCWGNQSDFDPNKDKISISAEDCQIENSLYIDGERTFGTFEINFDILENHKLPNWIWSLSHGNVFGLIPQMVYMYEKESMINFLSPRCLRHQVKNKHGQTLLMNFCLQKISPFVNLYDGYLNLHISRHQKVLRAKATLSGFSRENLEQLTKAILNFNFEAELVKN